MLSLRSDNPLDGEECRVGSAAYFRLDRKSLRAGPHDTHVASSDKGVWHVGGKTCVILVTESPATVRFEGDGASTHGPFERVLLADGAIWRGATLLAGYDADSGAWYSYADDKEFAVAVLAPAGGP